MHVKRMVAVLGAALILYPLVGCDWMQKKDPPGQKSAAELKAEQEARIRRACASEATYDRLKELAFDEAARIRGQDPRALDALAEAAVVRMEEPVAKSRDEDLNVTVCTGRFILELPPGAENAFDGQRRLTAEVEYAAQAAADGSGLVYHLSGAEPIIYRLATVGGMPRPQIAQAEPLPQPVPQQIPPAPAPKPDGTPQAEAPRKAEPPPRRTAASPSFSCARGRSRSERMVCSSGSLAALDRQMSSLFYSELANGDGRTRRELRRSRDRFLAYRERCPDEACIAQAYRDRMDEIRDIAAGR
jgi:hypothetical protein